MYAHEKKQTPLVIVEIPVHGEVDEIPIYECSNIEELTFKFIKRHSLQEKMNKPIQKMLIELMNEALAARQAKRNKQKELQGSKMNMQSNQTKQQDRDRNQNQEEQNNNNINNRKNIKLSQHIQNNYESGQSYNRSTQYDEQEQKNSKNILKSSKITKEYLTESSDSDYEQVKLANRSLRQSSKSMQSQNHQAGKANSFEGTKQQGIYVERKQPKQEEWILIGDGYGCREEPKGLINEEKQQSQADRNSGSSNKDFSKINDNNSNNERHLNTQNNTLKRDVRPIIKINNRVSRFNGQSQEEMEQLETTNLINSKSQDLRAFRDVSPNAIVDTQISRPSPIPTPRKQHKQNNNLQLDRQPPTYDNDDTEVDELIAPKVSSGNYQSSKVLQAKQNLDYGNAISYEKQQNSQKRSLKLHPIQVAQSSKNLENVYAQHSNSSFNSQNQWREQDYQSTSYYSGLSKDQVHQFPIQYSSSMSIQQNKSRSVTPRRRIFEKQGIVVSPIDLNNKPNNNSEESINYYDNYSGLNNSERSKLTSFRQITQLQESDKQLSQRTLVNRKSQY